MPKALKTVTTFGGIDADADALLDSCFQDHEAYLAAKEHRRFLVIGRKGSGKTAIFRKLVTEKDPTLFTFGHTFSDYPWHHHDAQAAIGVPEEERYAHSWKYLILLTAAKILLNQDSSQPWNEAAQDQLARLEDFVVDSYGSRDPDLTQLFAPGKTLKINPSLKIAFGLVELGAGIERVPIKELPTVVAEVNRSITDAVIASLNPDLSYHICFDQLDLGFSASDPKYAQRLIGLILAARDLSRKAHGAKRKLSVDIFLRDDIYDILQFEDKNKLTEAHRSIIEWDSPNTEWTLRRLMSKRFSEVLSIEEEDAWEQVFDETQEMRSRQSKYQHIIARTFNRPRDIIKFCNEVLDCYKTRIGPKPGEKFQNADVIAARDRYSEYLLKELDDEIFKHVPKYRSYLEVLKHIGTLQFNKAEFEAVRKERQDLFDSHTSTEQALAKLFEFSIIGFYRAGGGGGGSGYVWHYLDPRSYFDSSATSFRVHLGFKEALRLKQGGGDAE